MSSIKTFKEEHVQLCQCKNHLLSSHHVLGAYGPNTIPSTATWGLYYYCLIVQNKKQNLKGVKEPLYGVTQLRCRITFLLIATVCSCTTSQQETLLPTESPFSLEMGLSWALFSINAVPAFQQGAYWKALCLSCLEVLRMRFLVLF